jgi:hypothetical protein
MRKITTTFIAMIFVVSLVSLVSLVSAIGVTYPHPQNIELKPGQSSYFTFQIQTDDFPLTCIPSVQDNAGLEFAFNPQYDVEARQKFNVKPQVIIPKQTPYGNYKATFCIECDPAGEIEGSRIIPRICDLPITVNVVTERTRKNMLEEVSYLWLWMTLLIVAIVVLAITIFYLIRRRSRAAKV